MNKLLAGLLALAFSTASHAEFVTGNNLLQSLKKDSPQERAVAVGYIVGVTDTITGTVSCMPKTVTVQQIVDLTQQWLEQNPLLRHNSGDRVVVAVLGQAWPCETPKQSGKPV